WSAGRRACDLADTEKPSVCIRDRIWTRGSAGGIPRRGRARQALWCRSAARDGRSLALPAGQRRPVQAEKNLNERSALGAQATDRGSVRRQDVRVLGELHRLCEIVADEPFE